MIETCAQRNEALLLCPVARTIVVLLSLLRLRGHQLDQRRAQTRAVWKQSLWRRLGSRTVGLLSPLCLRSRQPLQHFGAARETPSDASAAQPSARVLLGIQDLPRLQNSRLAKERLHEQARAVLTEKIRLFTENQQTRRNIMQSTHLIGRRGRNTSPRMLQLPRLSEALASLRYASKKSRAPSMQTVVAHAA